MEGEGRSGREGVRRCVFDGRWFVEGGREYVFVVRMGRGGEMGGGEDAGLGVGV